jgi:hypothetical protein
MSPRLSDPEGRRALFETPPAPEAGTVGSGHPREGRDAFFSTGPHQPGTVIVECSACKVRSRISIIDAGVRIARLSLWMPLARHSRRIRCPSCHRRAWCRIGWLE